MNILSSGNEIVDKMISVNFTGNIISENWFNTITYENGKPNLVAIVVLSDIVYWYRPKEIRDEESGQMRGYTKRFKDDLLQRNYQQLTDKFGISKRQATAAVNALEELGVIKKVFRNIRKGGMYLNNVMYIELVPERLFQLTYGTQIEEISVSHLNVTPITVKSDRCNITKEGVLQPDVISPTIGCETNTKITTEIFNKKYNNPINQSELDTMDKINIYMDIIKENIEYDCLVHDCGLYGKELIDEIVSMIVETVAVSRKEIWIAGAKQPYQLVKGKFLKLDNGHIKYVIDCLHRNTSKIGNIKAYLLTALFNAPSTISNYYQAEVNYDMYGGGRFSNFGKEESEDLEE